MQREYIRGYGGVFRRDWRIYSIPDGKGGRKPLPFHGGLPMRSIAYFFASMAVLWLLLRLPVLGLLTDVAPAPLVYLGIPGIIAFVLTQIEPDGRPALRFVGSTIAHYLSPQTTSAGRPIRSEGTVAVYEPVTAIAASPDTTQLGPSRIHGPATVSFRDPVLITSHRRGRHNAVPQSSGGNGELATDVELEAGETLTVTP